MKYKSSKLAVPVGLFLFSAGAAAHHSLQGQFRTDSVIEVSGVITDMDWINPHSYVYLDELDESGNVVETWELETLPTAMFRKAGLTKAQVMGDGQPVTVRLHTARDGTSNLGYIIKITYADGRFYQLSVEP
ncbi:MAG TPA: DUF6152 family protein [Gammaproteobacteria bacterium]